MSEPRVLVVDDEPNIRDLVGIALRFHGFSVTGAGGGGEALDLAATGEFDLVVLDVMLPDVDGFEVCRRLRAAGRDVPIIFLTAKDTPADTVRGLTLGGDDYVTKPFSVDALVARARAVLRRGGRATARDEVLRVADLELDEAGWEVRRGGVRVELSPTEFRLLAFLMRHRNQVVTKAQLLEHVWGFGTQSQVVETYISYLRRKLDPLGPPLIHTQRGVGYALRTP
ncbi:DNA-binding response regulator [Planotetraspora thailandica]|uniref:DNA-binding response regulator n=1 Tax=Planotetraspora thailandica TaxID=487172 RepID=A0A8J4DFR8_9ACTN|nr:response regulator transcription factor [Planotetraspora thailandica]GII59475.1 DNA-binding response regulator [Planotetraspora thailandica]